MDFGQLRNSCTVSNSGNCLDGFGSTVRGDATLRRFEDPTASLYGKQGQVSYGFGDKTMRRIISHTFEEAKREENNAIQARQAGRPEGQRFQATHDLLTDLQRRRSQETREEDERRLRHIQDTMAGILHQMPIYQTSADNPLNPLFPESASSAGGTQQKDTKQMLRARSLNSHLDLSTFLPIEEPPAPVDPAVEEAKQQELRKQQELKELEMEIIRQYPHGVPKRIQREMLQQKGLVLSGFQSQIGISV